MTHPYGSGSQPRENWWPGAEAFRIKPTTEVPADIQRSFLLWMGAAALVVVSVVLSVGALGYGPGGNYFGAILHLVFAVAMLYGAAQMRRRKAWGRVLTAAVGGVVGLLYLINFFNLLSYMDLIMFLTGGALLPLAIISLIMAGGICALIITAMVFMFRPPASQYLANQ